MTKAGEVHNCEAFDPGLANGTGYSYLQSGYRQDGEEWTCPACGKTWVHVCDEAEGCAWYPKEVVNV
jgi:hypothetical protein